MSYLRKSGIALIAIFLAGTMALPYCQAQTRVMQNIFQLDTSGAYLGIQMKDVTADDVSRHKLGSERGVIISSVLKGSPAETAALKEGDVILEFGGYPVWSTMQLSRLVKETPVGRKVELVISRDGKRMNLSAKLENRDSRNAENRMDAWPEDFFRSAPKSFEFRLPAPDRAPGEPSTNKPRLGITIQPLTDQLGEFMGVPDKKGVLVASVLTGSPSAGKLKSGDVIISVDGKSIETPEELTQIVRDKSEGSVMLKVIRDKKEITVTVNLSTADEKGYKL